MDPKRLRQSGDRVALAAALLALGACGTNGDASAARPQASAASSGAASSAPTTTAEDGSSPLLVRTRIAGFDGKVLAGSVIGESSFCRGGGLHHARGSPEIGFAAINEFRCDDGTLRIGFGPGPAQMTNLVQTSVWRVLDGTGRYANATGDGRMVVQFEPGEPPRGVETFLGLIVLQ